MSEVLSEQLMAHVSHHVTWQGALIFKQLAYLDSVLDLPGSASVAMDVLNYIRSILLLGVDTYFILKQKDIKKSLKFHGFVLRIAYDKFQ